MTKGKKQDQNKLRLDLLPVSELKARAEVMTYGSKKYNENPHDPNWKKVEDPLNRYYAALLRHLFAWRDGEFIDSESGLPHLSHAIFNVVCLSWHSKNQR